ncbi:helix-turn-helix domain-containing protein [Nostoc sp. FACHB-87]|uniref:helix-turn-helix domain-containing protein n=1 Tax=Nostocales TaxID=1161 RepID=UPI0016824332|nr:MULTISPECIES: helix-turn-helix domain-containing protein [Nostocales]MBD2298701.1 helix-turn-helix domain-containing protein [Nostoc sp. FACHB-190]MBD2454471.1 helix-turn-helix domain-containing protein [Nostoc sp. FACHB-87]MBD2474343.1 helix-turn-helix domain-containing protein [Anabaena sp. FACHB-83]MBD2487111.1 helix-turn-helix domain-containing protein [Aulosira sp. FACHB-615]
MSHKINQFPDLESYKINPSKLLTPFQKKILLKNLQTNLQPEYRRRIEVMLLADQGQSPSKICQILGCSYHMARYWTSIAKAGLAHQWQEQKIGRPKLINEQYLDRLKQLVTHNPQEYGYPFQNWTAQWLSKHLANEMSIKITERHISRLLKQMGLSTKQKNNSNQQETKDMKDSEIIIYDLYLNGENNNLSELFDFVNTYE